VKSEDRSTKSNPREETIGNMVGATSSDGFVDLFDYSPFDLKRTPVRFALSSEGPFISHFVSFDLISSD